ncbi:MAG TPA: carboxymuconolactone decarboxylase family protein [Alphaproteobacteria bacterium]
MTIDALQSRLPDYAKDIRLNLTTLAGEEGLTAQQKWGAFYATALASGNGTVIQAFEAEASGHLNPQAMDAVRAAASIMAMNNIYYKFAGTMGESYQTMPARLRMNVIGNPGVDKIDFELWSLAVSAINGCQYCVLAHEAKLIATGMSREQIQAAVRIAAVVHAIAATLNGEDARRDKEYAAA